ncbi:MAG: DUF1857 family protein [Rhodocyclaceae bacterium]|nr:DUF1857 family protein [Rhodocyclaceae bacterium]
MNFEHLVEINSASLPLHVISRQQLWAGLVLRAEKPEMSLIGLDECLILAREPDGMRRELRFGNFHIRDRVRFVPTNYVIYEVEATAATPASTLIMAIEEPEENHLFVRFTYARARSEGEPEMDAFYADHLKQAYTQADIDTIATIRRLAEEGMLDSGR